LRKYETIFIVKPTLTDTEIQERINYVKDVLIAEGAEIAVDKSIGMRDLAYEIKKNKRGFYQLFYFQAPATAIKELERIFTISEDIIRFMNVKYENTVEVTHWDDFVAKHSPKEEEIKTETVEEVKTEAVEEVVTETTTETTTEAKTEEVTA